MTDCDVAVVGGSLAGSFIAHCLGNEGFRVKLIEPSRFPRRKACGEGLSVLALPYLRAAGLWSAELQSAALPFYGYDIWQLNGKRCLLGGKSKLPELYSIPRWILDENVQKAALSNSQVELCQESVSSFERKGSEWRIQTENQVVNARQLVLAAGAAGRTLLNIPPSEDNTKSTRYGFVAWVKGSWQYEPPRNVPIIQRESYELVLTPERDGILNISVLISKSAQSRCKHDREWYLVQALEIAKTLGFSPESAIEVRGVPDISASRLATAPKLIYTIGDLLERFDPIGGMGMTHAVFSATEAARAICDALRGKSDILSWQSYLERCERGARYLRMSSWMSFSLNVARRPLLQSLIRRAPKLSYQAHRLIKGGFKQQLELAL